MIFSFQPILIKQFYHIVIQGLIIYVASNKLIITCLDYQSTPKKLMTMANISCAPLNISQNL